MMGSLYHCHHHHHHRRRHRNQNYRFLKSESLSVAHYEMQDFIGLFTINLVVPKLSSYQLPILKAISFHCFPIISPTFFTFIYIYAQFVPFIFLWYQNIFCSMVERSLNVVPKTHLCFIPNSCDFWEFTVLIHFVITSVPSPWILMD
jgi:hypothetical protein